MPSSDKSKYSISPDFRGYQNRQDRTIQTYFDRPGQSLGAFGSDVIEIGVSMKKFADQVARFLFGAINSELNSLLDTDDDTRTLSTFTFNWYEFDPSKPDLEGISSHADFGYITVLLQSKPGLKAIIDGEWIDVPPKPGYAVINFGRAIEIMTNGRIKAAIHKVVEFKGDTRFSVGLFIDVSLNGKIIKFYEEDTKPEYSEFIGMNGSEFIAKCFTETYE